MKCTTNTQQLLLEAARRLNDPADTEGDGYEAAMRDLVEKALDLTVVRYQLAATRMRATGDDSFALEYEAKVRSIETGEYTGAHQIAAGVAWKTVEDALLVIAHLQRELADLEEPESGDAFKCQKCGIACDSSTGVYDADNGEGLCDEHHEEQRKQDAWAAGGRA